MLPLAGRRACSIAVGDSHTCAVLEGLHIVCWGANQYGQLGLGSQVPVGKSVWQMGENLLSVNLAG